LSRFLRFFAALFTLNVIITGGVWMAARTATPASQTYGFDSCDGIPCFLGVTPGFTAWRDAKQALAQYDDDLTEKMLRIPVSNTMAWVETVDGSHVGRISVYAKGETTSRTWAALSACSVHHAACKPHQTADR
jgi:hypothetical protein